MTRSLYAFFGSSLVYVLCFCGLLGTWGFIDRNMDDASIFLLPWFQWPFELLALFMTFFVNDVIYGNIKQFLYTVIVSSLITGIFVNVNRIKGAKAAVVVILVFINLVTAFSIMEDLDNIFLNRKIGIYAVFWGVPISFHLACRTASLYMRKEQDSADGGTIGSDLSDE